MQGADKEEYTIKGDKSILNFLKFSPSIDLRMKYYQAIANSGKDNVPVLLQLLYHRLNKAKVLGFQNIIDLNKNERAFQISPIISKVEAARKLLSQSISDDVHLLKFMTGIPSYNIANCIFEKEFVMKELENLIVNTDEHMGDIHNIFTFSNVLKGIVVMVRDLFGCSVQLYSLTVDPNGNVTEKPITKITEEHKHEMTNVENQDFTAMDDPDMAYIFRLEIEHKGRKSEIYLDLLERNHKNNGINATFTIQGS